MATKSILHKTFLAQPLRMYALEIENTHTFFVGKYSILTHNIVLPLAASLGFTIPFGSSATGTLGSFFGPVGMIGGFVIGGLVSVAFKVLYENRIHRYKTQTYDIAFIQAQKPTGCFNLDDTASAPNTHILPIENPLPKNAIGCIEIEISPVLDKRATKCYEISDKQETTNNDGCFQTPEQNEQHLCATQEKDAKIDDSNDRYSGPWARNWKEFERDCPVQLYGKKFIPTGKQNPKDGAPLRKLLEDIPNTEMFKKDRLFAIDKLHKDHFEVWDRKGKWIGVANLDGSKNQKKTNAEGDPESRNIRKNL